MKRWLSGLSATFVMALSGLVPQLVYSQPNAKWYFYCGKSADGLIATIVKQPNEREIVLIVWESKIWSSDTKLAAKERCETATKNFQEASEEGSLIYLTGTKVDDYPAICASKEEYGNCDKLLFTLRKEENVDFVLADLGYYSSGSEVFSRTRIRNGADVSGNSSVNTNVQVDTTGRRNVTHSSTTIRNNSRIRNNGDTATIQGNDQSTQIQGKPSYVSRVDDEPYKQSAVRIDVELWINNMLNREIPSSRSPSSRSNPSRRINPIGSNSIQVEHAAAITTTTEYTQINFVCVYRKLISTTVLRTSKGDIPIIVWKSDAFASSGWTNEKRCQEVTNRFENLRQKSALNYITSGVINDLSAICAVKAENEPCTSEGLLFTLGKDTDPKKILKQMFVSNSDIPVDDNGVGKRDGRDSVCMSRSASGNCSGLLISAIEL